MTSQLSPEKQDQLERRALELGQLCASPVLAAELALRQEECRRSSTGAGGIDPGTSPELLAKLVAQPFLLSRRFTDI